MLARVGAGAALLRSLAREARHWPALAARRLAPSHGLMSSVDHTKDPVTNDHYYRWLAVRLKRAGAAVDEGHVSLAGFRRWLVEFEEMERSYDALGDVRVEKCLEHYLGVQHLALEAGDVFLDVAAAGSPFARLVETVAGVVAYRLDLCYPRGLNGRDIGADATETGLPDDFVNAIALHCAYECFEGDADVRFWREAARILRPRGRVVIVPLYLDDVHYVAVSPRCRPWRTRSDPGARRVWRDDEYEVPFSRHYSPEALVDRVVSRMDESLDCRIVHLTNLPAVMEAFPGQRVYCHFILVAEKRS